uniref:OSJNBa0022F16.18 protein n=1 Tax=Oryza sativa subsp. japonica TaxID=39947 RepID=Q7XKY6_ORYSJ|nr:OSJNBa0022F16.18 [Oryza sativa Japonica Group]
MDSPATPVGLSPPLLSLVLRNEPCYTKGCDRRDRYFFLTPPYPPAFHALLGEVDMLATESAPYLVDPTVTQPPAPEIVHTPLISTPSPQLGSSLETPIQVDSKTEGTDTEPEIEPDITDPSEDETPVHRITFVGGPRTLSTACKSTRPSGKKPKLDPETPTSEPWGLRFARASDHPLPAPGSCGWLDD